MSKCIQCFLKKGNRYTTQWIPVDKAKVGETVTIPLAAKVGSRFVFKASDGWEIVKAYDRIQVSEDWLKK